MTGRTSGTYDGHVIGFAMFLTRRGVISETHLAEYLDDFEERGATKATVQAYRAGIRNRLFSAPERDSHPRDRKYKPRGFWHPQMLRRSYLSKQYHSGVPFNELLQKNGRWNGSGCADAYIDSPGRYLSTEKISEVLGFCRSIGDAEYGIVALLVGTGLRASEACALTWADVEEDRNAGAWFVVGSGKGGKPFRQEVGIPDALDALARRYGREGPLLRRVDGTAMDRGALHYQVERIGKLAVASGIAPFASGI